MNAKHINIWWSKENFSGKSTIGVVKKGRKIFCSKSFHSRCIENCTTSFLVVVTAIALLSGCSALPRTSQDVAADKTNQTSQLSGQESNMGSLKVDSVVTQPIVSDDVIRPGDQVQVTVWGYPEFNTTTTVKDYGTITIPLVGDVIAAGLTEKELTAQVKERLGEYVKGDARVTISHIGMDKRVSVMGAVVKQGNYPVMSSVSLVEIIAAAGGTSTDADLKHVKIFRHGQPSDAIEVDLSNYLESGTFQDVPKVGPGDTVFVPQQENIIREISTFGQDILVLFGFFALLK